MLTSHFAPVVKAVALVAWVQKRHGTCTGDTQQLMVCDEVMNEKLIWRFVLALKAKISTLRGTHDEGILFIGHKIADTAYTTKRIETDNFFCVVCSHRKTNDLNVLYFNCLLKTLADLDKNDRLRTTRHVGSTHLS